MQDAMGIPACFSTGERSSDDPAAVTRSGQSVFMSVYKTKIADQCWLITVTWCKNSLLHGLSVSLQGPDGENHYNCKVELKPWYFWRKQGCKRFLADGKPVDIFWDLKLAKFDGETEPDSEYYVAVVCDEEVVLLVGDLKKDAYRRTGCRPALIDPILVSRREHIFGKKRFNTRAKLYEKGGLHEISIECKNRHPVNPSESNGGETEMEIRVDGQPLIHVRHLQWKFRGNECIYINKLRVEVYWDVHDWLFSPGLRHALFIFKPVLASLSPSPPLSSESSSQITLTPLSSQTEWISSGGSSDFCLFLYAWKIERMRLINQTGKKKKNAHRIEKRYQTDIYQQEEWANWARTGNGQRTWYGVPLFVMDLRIIERDKRGRKGCALSLLFVRVFCVFAVKSVNRVR